MTRIIGFGHRSRVGKDTAANFLTGFLRQTTRNKLVIKTGFANKLKAITHDLYAWAGLEPGDYYETNEAARNIKLPFIGKTPVEIWIEFGTTVGRACYVDTWVKYPLSQKFDFLIISDVRFPNEIDEIRKAGGKVIKIERPDAPVRDSVADNMLQDYKGWDAVIVNNGDLKQLNTTVIEIYKGFK